MPSLIEPRSPVDGKDPARQGAEPVALADGICQHRGVRLTRMRILELPWETGCPTGAHKLMRALEQSESCQIRTPAVYRAIEFLMSQGLVTKIESRNAYVLCVHPEREDECLFFICHGCGVASEVEGRGLEQLIAEDASDLDFRVSQGVVEVQGTCDGGINEEATGCEW